MTAEQGWLQLEHELARREREGTPLLLWLRDDDATMPGPALEKLLGLTSEFSVPVAIAVIPGLTAEPLAKTLARSSHALPVIHGWKHINHAPRPEKKQELGPHRPLAAVEDDLAAALARMSQLYGDRLVPMLVPPWNRIRSDILPRLPGLGFKALSVFGRKTGQAPLPVHNTHVDLIDWHGTRGCRENSLLIADLLREVADPGPVGPFRIIWFTTPGPGRSFANSSR